MCRLQGVSGVALTEAHTLACELQDVAVMGEPVHQGAKESLVAEDLSPIVEGWNGGGDGWARRTGCAGFTDLRGVDVNSPGTLWGGRQAVAGWPVGSHRASVGCISIWGRSGWVRDPTARRRAFLP